MTIDYHIHLERDTHFEKCPYTIENIEAYLEVAEKRGIHELGITEHCNRFAEFFPLMKELADGEGAYPETSEWLRNICTETLEEYVTYLFKMKELGYPIKIGIEVEYILGREEELKKILKPYPWDYILGSVHFLGNWSIDFSKDMGWPERDIDSTYREYINTLKSAAKSEIFDVLAHIDLIKKFGYRPKEDLSGLWLDCLDSIASKDLAIEVSTAGLRKAVKEIYPSKELLLHCKERNKIGRAHV